MHISMIGAGYVGLVSGACLADCGHVVTCVDLDADRIARLNRGEMPIFEPGLQSLVDDTMTAGRLRFSTDLERVVAASDVVFIAVGTPSRRGDGHADLAYVHRAAEMIGRAMTGFTVVVTKSTVPVGTGDEVAMTIARVNPRADFAVVSNPEFLREGAAIEDFRKPDRVVIGVEEERARRVMKDVYGPLRLAPGSLLFTGRRTAELIKYASNAFLAMKTTFINEIADLCERVGADVQEVAHGMGLDNRIGRKCLDAGPGYGGSCLPKDTRALLKTAQDHGVPLRLVEATVSVNDARRHAIARKVLAACGGSVRGRTIGILGLTFKPGTDDMRDAPSIAIMRILLDHGARLRAYDPEGMDTARAMIDGVEYTGDAYSVAKDADCLVIVTEWDEFRTLDLDRIRCSMRAPRLVDLRNIYRPDDVMRAGLSYTSIGRGTAPPRWNQLDAAE